MAATKSTPLSATDRDTVIRTIIGEAANEGAQGWAAVAHVIRNRQYDSRFPSNAHAVARQPLQFSAWNSKGRLQGNDLVRTRGPNTRIYQQIGDVVDRVYGGQIADPTGGATHYYAPRGMPGGRNPSWWTQKTSESGGFRTIGNHRFAGRSNGVQTPTQSSVPLQNYGYSSSATPNYSSSDNPLASLVLSSLGLGASTTAQGATGASGLFPAFSKQVVGTSKALNDSLTSSLFNEFNTEPSSVGKFDNLFGAYFNE